MRLPGLIWCAALGLASPVFAQELPFSSHETEVCLKGASDVVVAEACIGESARACIDTPDGYTTVGMSFCYGVEASYWDDRLSIAFRDLMAFERKQIQEIEEFGGTLPDAPGALRDMQRSWRGFRDAACAYEYTTWGGGTGGGPATAACLMFETGRQALALERRLEDRSQ